MSSLSLARKDFVSLPPAGKSTVGHATCPVATSSGGALRVLHLFNRYRVFGGEEAAVNRTTAALRESGALVDECFFTSEDWERNDSPPRPRQILLTLKNAEALAKVRGIHLEKRTNLWLAHNILPVLSPGVLSEANRQRVPIALYLHNYRPFSVSGSLWAGDRVETAGLRKNFVPEILAGAWQDSVPRTAFMAMVLWTAHALGWYRRVNGWIAVSTFVRDRFVEAGVPREKTHVLAYPFVPTERPTPTAKREHFLFLGRLTVAKGVRVLLRAWEIVRAKTGDTAPKMVIGGEGELEKEVRAAADASGGSIEYLGNVGGEAKAKLIASSQAMIVPSIWWDPYPTVVYEAYDQACPVLAARSGGLPESVAHERTGLLHEAGDAETLADHILRLHYSTSLTASLGAAGRRWLLENSGVGWWWERFAEITGEIRERHAVEHGA